jgi:hypothetical protein
VESQNVIAELISVKAFPMLMTDMKKFNWHKLYLWFSCFSPLGFFESWIVSPFDLFKNEKWFNNN